MAAPAAHTPGSKEETMTSLQTPMRLGWTRRRFAATGLPAAGVAATACGQIGSGAPPSQEAREVTVSNLTDWEGAARLEFLKTAIPKFTEENPKIHVDVNYAQTLGSNSIVVSMAAAAAGTLQDTLLGPISIPNQLAKLGALQDI